MPGDSAAGAPGRPPSAFAKVHYACDLTASEPYDVVVCGGGPAGIAAALAARRAGRRVLLAEGTAQLGGMGTSGLVSHWLGGRTPDNRRQVVAGIFLELTREAVARGIALDPERIPEEEYPPHGWLKSLATGVPFDPFAMAALLDARMLAEGVEVLLCTQFVDVRREGERITHAILFNKSGLQAVSARAVVDATGDADVAYRSGCRTVRGREGDGLMAPATLEFHVDNVDQDALAAEIYAKDSPRFRELIRSLREQGEWPFACDVFISVQLQEKGTMMINTPRICDVDGTDGASLTQGIMRGRSEVFRLLDVMRRHFPGFADVRLKGVAPLLGIRETRRVVGDFVLTVDDVLTGRDFPDTIGFTGYGWDLPDPKRPSQQPMAGKSRPRPVTPIPYRCLLPRPVTNLICPGRAVSVEREVLGPLRVQAPCFAMGQAAGVAAAMVVERRVPFRDLDVAELRERLRQGGAIVDWDG